MTFAGDRRSVGDRWMSPRAASASVLAGLVAIAAIILWPNLNCAAVDRLRHDAAVEAARRAGQRIELPVVGGRAERRAAIAAAGRLYRAHVAGHDGGVLRAGGDRAAADCTDAEHICASRSSIIRCGSPCSARCWPRSMRSSPSAFERTEGAGVSRSPRGRAPARSLRPQSRRLPSRSSCRWIAAISPWPWRWRRWAPPISRR